MQIADDRAEALYRADAADQIAIFDLETFDEIRTDEGIKGLREAGTYDAQAHAEQRRAKAQLDRVFGTARHQGDTRRKTTPLPHTWIELPANVKDKVTELARAWSADQAKKQAAKGNMWMQKIQDSYWAFFDKFAKYGDYRVQ